MDFFILTLAIPLVSGLLLAFAGERAWAPNLNAIASLGTFLASALLTAEIVANSPRFAFGEMFFIDSLNVFFVALTAFVGLTTSIFSGPYMRNERAHGKLSQPRMRLYKSMFQLFMFTMLTALTTNNLGILWVAMEAATLTTVLLVSLYRTAASLEAAWKYFILCGVGIAQALFGTILLYFAAERVLGATGNALLWTHLVEVKGQLEPTIMVLSFIFLLVGYGTKVGLAPLHNWLPDAHAEGPTPVSAVLSGLLLNVALYAILRCKVLADGAIPGGFAGNLMMGFGLLTLVVAAFFLSRQKDIKRMFAYSSIEHMGLITFAFGMGGAVANFAGLLHMTLHSLTKSAIFFAVGHAAQKTGTQQMEDIRGLININPVIGWGLMLGTLAILGMPPFGVFASEFMILTHAMKHHPWATPVLLLALGVAFAAIFGKVQPMVFGETHARRLPHAPAITPVFVHLAIVLMLGLYIPPYLTRWFHEAARMLGLTAMRLLDEPIEFTPQTGSAAPVWSGRATDGAELQRFAIAAHRAGGRLAALWGADERLRKGGFRLHCVFGLNEGHARVGLDLPAQNPACLDLAGIFPAANRMQRATRDLVGIAFEGGDQRPWLRHGAWPADWFPLRHDAADGVEFPNAPSDYDFVQVGGEGAHEIPVGPIHAGIIEPGHFRFSVIGERVLRLEQRLGYLHKGVEKLFGGRSIADGARLAGRVSGDATCAYAWAYAAAVEAACGVPPPPRALMLRALMLERERVANHLGDLGALGNDAALAFGFAQFMRLKEDWLRVNGALFGHRFMMDRIVPGGTALDLEAPALRTIADQCDAIGREVKDLRKIYDEHAGLQDRFQTTGAIDADLARELSLTGVAARATGLILDGRTHRQGYTPPPPYAALGVRPATDERGDVAARVAVRFAELVESLRLLRKLADGLPEGASCVEVPPLPGGSGLGVIEGWRGEVLVGVSLDGAGRLARVHPHDPSWQIWPALERAVLRDIVPDFPLINKSFNLSYSGADL